MELSESHTIEECIEKINKEKEIFKDSDSTFVLDGILEMCKVNPNFRNNFMREEKTFSGALTRELRKIQRFMTSALLLPID